MNSHLLQNSNTLSLSLATTQEYKRRIPHQPSVIWSLGNHLKESFTTEGTQQNLFFLYISEVPSSDPAKWPTLASVVLKQLALLLQYNPISDY